MRVWAGGKSMARKSETILFLDNAETNARKRLQSKPFVGVWRSDQAVTVGLLDKSSPSEPSPIVFLTGVAGTGAVDICFNSPFNQDSSKCFVPFGGGHNPLQTWNEFLDSLLPLEL
jgi:hypothetical protein